MTRLPLQRTRFNRALERLAALLLGNMRGSWRHRSTVLLALLLGYYGGSNVTAYLMVSFPGGRPLAVVLMLVLVELLVRLRGRLATTQPGLGWLVLDNLRIGAVYAVVLEAFKLGT